MPRSLTPIPAGVEITEGSGTITTFFRLAWQALVDSFQFSPSVASTQQGPPATAALSAAVPTTSLFTTKQAGLYRISFYLRKTRIDGVNSSLQVTLGWVENGVALSETGAAVVPDSVTVGQQSGEKLVWADTATSLTIAIAYASNTPAQMQFRYDALVELVV